MSLTAGTRISSYEIFAPIGAGRMGEVYRAKDQKLGRDVAIKILPEEFARDSRMEVVGIGIGIAIDIGCRLFV